MKTAAEFTAILTELGSEATPVDRKVALFNALHPDLERVFDRVRPTTHWKDPIDTIVELDADELAMLPYAVEYFTATTPTITPVPNRHGWTLYLVKADGYRRGPAGDH